MPTRERHGSVAGAEGPMLLQGTLGVSPREAERDKSWTAAGCDRMPLGGRMALTQRTVTDHGRRSHRVADRLRGSAGCRAGTQEQRRRSRKRKAACRAFDLYRPSPMTWKAQATTGMQPEGYLQCAQRVLDGRLKQPGGLPAGRADGFGRQPMATACLCEADGRDARDARPGAQESRLKLGPCGM